MRKEKEQFGFENLPDCAVDYIRLVIKKMRWQKKTRKDVEAELIAHFEDALKDCKTDAEKQTTAEKLITEFGDAKLIATLARRAKKRCRPLWQKTVIKAFQTFGITIGLFILYVIWFISGRPKITTDYVAELNQIVKPSDSNDSQNAAFYYTEAAKKIKDFPKDLKEVFEKSYYECNEPERKSASDWLAKNQEVLNLISLGSEKPFCWHKYEAKDNELLSMPLPHFGEYRNFTRILCWKACFSAEQENYEQAFENIITTYQLGKHMRSEPLLISQLVAMAIESIATQNLRQILSSYNINASELQKLQNTLIAITQNEIFTINFKTEKLCMYDEIQRCFTDDFFGGHIYFKRFGKLDNWVYSGEGVFGTLKDLFKIFFSQPDKNETLKAADEFYNYLDEVSTLTPVQRKQLKSENTNSFERIAYNNLFLQILTPAFGKVFTLGYRNKADVEATLTIVAIIRYKQDTDVYPDSLGQLVDKGYLKKIPIDPYSDKPLIYKKTENGFTLYSFGSDFDDDGGKMGVAKGGTPSMWNTEDGDAVFWPVVHPK